jgi:spermidine synthase
MPEKHPVPEKPIARPELLVTVFSTGAGVMVVEILGTRIIGPVFGVSLFVWTALLVVTLASLAAGYYAGGVLVDKQPERRLLGYVVVAAGALLGIVPALRAPVLSLCQGLGPRFGSLISAAILFAPCLVAMGMTGPVAIRLATNDLHATGHRVGSVYAISTAGSVLGALITSFVLIPGFETSHILVGTALFIILVGAVPLARRGQPASLAAVILPFIGLADLSPNLPAGLSVLERAQSPYSLVEVIDDANRDVRLLRADHSIIGAQVRSDKSAAFSFLHVLEAVRFARPKAQSLLQIGLGIGSLPMALKPRGIVSDIVEIDPEVVRFARQYFGFSTEGAEFVEDARTLIQRIDRHYDIVVHDTFTGGGTPEHLLSLEVVQRIRSLLRPAGVLALNFVGYDSGPKAEATFAVARTLKAVFPVVRLFRDSAPSERPNGATNLLFFASSDSLDFRIPPDAKFETELCANILKSFADWEILKSVPDGPIITDGHNPLARLQLPIAEEHFDGMHELLPREVWVR